MGRGQLFWIKWQHYAVTDTEMYCLAITFLNQNIFWWGKKKKTMQLSLWSKSLLSSVDVINRMVAFCLPYWEELRVWLSFWLLISFSDERNSGEAKDRRRKIENIGRDRKKMVPTSISACLSCVHLERCLFLGSFGSKRICTLGFGNGVVVVCWS